MLKYKFLLCPLFHLPHSKYQRNLSESFCHLVHVHVLGNGRSSCWSIPGILGIVVCVEEKKRKIGAILAEVLGVLVLVVLVLLGMVVFSGDGSRYDVGSDGVDSNDGNSDDVELPWNHVDHPLGEAGLLHKLSNCQTTEMLTTRSLINLIMIC